MNGGEEISPTMPFVAAERGADGAPRGLEISPTLPFVAASAAARTANVEISPTMPFVLAPKPPLPPMDVEISPTMPFVAAPQGSSFEISPTQHVAPPCVQHDPQSAEAAKTSASEKK